MITLKIGKAICPVCDVNNLNRAFSRGGVVENKDWTKAEIG